MQRRVNLSQFCSSNYISESTLKRYFRKVNILLEPLGYVYMYVRNNSH